MTDDRDPMDPQAWYGEPDVCGSCIAWRPGEPRPGEEVAAGTCRLRAELSRVPATLRKCDLYKGRGKFVYQPGRAPPTRKKKNSAPRVLRRTADGEMVEDRPVRSSPSEPRPPKQPIERPEVPRNVDVGTDDAAMLRRVITNILRSEMPATERELHGRFEGGKVVVKATDGRSKQIDVEQFFRMLEGFRSALVELEDAVVRTDALLPLVPEVTKQIKSINGSFTTFNILYHSRTDYFSGK